MADGVRGAQPGKPLTFAEAVHTVRDMLSEIANAPHEDFEGHGGLCPICGLVGRLRTALEDYRDD